MKTITTMTLLASGLLAAGAGSDRADQDIITKSFSVKTGGKLVMNVDRGSIHVTTSDSDKVDVKVVREVRRASASQAKEVLEQHKIEITESGNEVTVDARKPQKHFWGNNLFNNLRVDYTVA